MVGNKSWRGWRPLWRWGWARRRRWRGRRWRRRRLRWGAWATEPAPTAFAVGAVLYGELAYAPRLAHSMMRIPLRRRGAEGWRRGRRRIGRRPWRPAHRASASRAALAFAKLPCVSGKTRESRAARQSAQRRARNATQSTKEAAAAARSNQCTAVACGAPCNAARAPCRLYTSCCTARWSCPADLQACSLLGQTWAKLSSALGFRRAWPARRQRAM